MTLRMLRHSVQAATIYLEAIRKSGDKSAKCGIIGGTK